uniref:Uncharacterized protein n=1 Tax=Physcomitrium patens TaxID=3218 RepID=A9REX2_PHYPA|nr:hypothetical protein PHYPA_017251 [Physcomitrium patens]
MKLWNLAPFGANNRHARSQVHAAESIAPAAVGIAEFPLPRKWRKSESRLRCNGRITSSGCPDRGAAASLHSPALLHVLVATEHRCTESIDTRTRDPIPFILPLASNCPSKSCKMRWKRNL